MKLSDFEYPLPSSLIAQKPSYVRDESRLLIVNKKSGSIEESTFKNITEHLLPSDTLVLNDTKVIAARLKGTKNTGGKIEILLLHHVSDSTWMCLTKGSYTQGTRIIFVPHILEGKIIKKAPQGRAYIDFFYEGDLTTILERCGQIPLPPYIKRSSTDPYDRKRYQTVYSRCKGAVAAPTAGLHFTQPLLDKIHNKGVEIVFLTLHIGTGTFLPVRVENIKQHVMEKEYYILPSSTLMRIRESKKKGHRIIAVGTTTTRVLESCAPLILDNTFIPSHNIQGWTDLFIYPPYAFTIVDKLITNFHLPKSTLLMLVSAFCGYTLCMKAYHYAIKRSFRFYSYGDSMLIK
ncbi:MAG: tRNA preQ1(34) S-adenosylmethionine ribosyltransferase-isomerase QueA [bacterium]